MITRRLRAVLSQAPRIVSSPAASVPAHAQWIVFDPTNYAQNVLTAARELQQVNNEIQMLENQATSLINQARNLASLPYSSLAQLEQSITQTQQLLAQAQRIAYSVSTIDQAFTQQLSAGLFGLDLVAAASRRRSIALAERARGLPGHHAGAGRRRQNLNTTRTQIDALVSVEPVRHRRASSRAVRQSARRPSDQAARRPHRRHGVDRAGPES